MKRIPFTLSMMALMLGVFFSGTAAGQEEEAHELRIRIQKEVEGKLKKIDTILSIHEDSMRTYWYSLDHERLDSIREEIHRKMEEIDRVHLRKVREKMKDLRPEMERLRDSLERHRIEVIIPRMHQLDSLRKEGLKIDLDSLHRKMIIRMDSLGEKDFDLDVEINSDSIRRAIDKSLKMLDSLDIGEQLGALDLDDHIRAAMYHARVWMDDGDFGSEGDRNGTDLKFLDGKVLKIKTDSRGRVVKVIILSPDGETLEVKEGREAREFMTRDGERVTISEVER